MSLNPFKRTNGHQHPPLQLINGAVNLDDAFQVMKAEEFVHKPRVRTYETAFRQYVENRESINSTIDLLRQQCALEETLLVELDTLLADAKTGHQAKLEEIATVEASIPRAPKDEQTETV